MNTTAQLHEQDSPAATTARGELRRGRKPLASGAIAYGAGPLIFLTTNGLFVEPIMQSTGLSATEVQYGSVVLLFTGFFGPVAGWLFQRFQARRVLLAGYAGLLIPAGMFMLLPPSASTFYAIAAFAGVLGAMCFNVGWAKLMSTWFDRSYGTALGFATAGGSLLPMLVTPVIVYFIYAYDWRAGFAVLLATVAIFGLLPVFFGVFDGPLQKQEISSVSADGQSVMAPQARKDIVRRLIEAFRDIRIWMAVLAFAFACFGIGGFLTSVQPMLLLNGFSIQFASTMSMVFILGNASGLAIGGILLDRFWPYMVPLVVCLAAAGGAMGLALSTPEWAGILVASIVYLVGLATGADSIFIPYFVRRLAHESVFPIVLGFAGIVTGLSTTVGTLTFAAIRDATGSYATASLIGGAAFIVAGILLLTIGLIARSQKDSSVPSTVEDGPNTVDGL